MLASAVGYRHLEVVQIGLKVLQMGNAALLLRETQGMGLSSLFLLTPSFYGSLWGACHHGGLSDKGCSGHGVGLPTSCLGGSRTLCSMVLVGERRSFSSTGKGVTWPLCSHLPGVRICSDVVALLPRDLKRDVAKKLEKLEKRTQRAIAELIRALWCRRDGVMGSPVIPEGLHGPYWELSALLLGWGRTGGA